MASNLYINPRKCQQRWFLSSCSWTSHQNTSQDTLKHTPYLINMSEFISYPCEFNIFNMDFRCDERLFKFASATRNPATFCWGGTFLHPFLGASLSADIWSWQSDMWWPLVTAVTAVITRRDRKPRLPTLSGRCPSTISWWVSSVEFPKLQTGKLWKSDSETTTQG